MATDGSTGGLVLFGGSGVKVISATPGCGTAELVCRPYHRLAHPSRPSRERVRRRHREAAGLRRASGPAGPSSTTPSCSPDGPGGSRRGRDQRITTIYRVPTPAPGSATRPAAIPARVARRPPPPPSCPAHAGSRAARRGSAPLTTDAAPGRPGDLDWCGLRRRGVGHHLVPLVSRSSSVRRWRPAGRLLRHSGRSGLGVRWHPPFRSAGQGPAGPISELIATVNIVGVPDVSRANLLDRATRPVLAAAAGAIRGRRPWLASAGAHAGWRRRSPDPRQAGDPVGTGLTWAGGRPTLGCPNSHLGDPTPTRCRSPPAIARRTRPPDPAGRTNIVPGCARRHGNPAPSPGKLVLP